MTRHQAPAALTVFALALLSASCVQYYPVAAYPPPTQPPVAPPEAPPSPPQVAEAPAALPAPQDVVAARSAPSATERLLGPVALYPDPLIALILPASTAPADVSAAAAYLVQYGDGTQIDSQPWDASVRALAHYPAIISWMAENMEWTRAVGSAFLSSPGDVMDSIQRLRARAIASGALASTAQQRVVVEDNTVEIVPAQPNAIYAPAYDTDVVYADESYDGYGGPYLNFGDALPVGLWLSYCFDWQSHSVWVGGWGAWHGPGGWHHPHFGGGHVPPGMRPWHPPGRGHGSAPPGPGRHGDSVPIPHPMPGAPNPPPDHFRRPVTQAGMRPAAPGSAVPVPKTAPPPMDRPRLQIYSGSPQGASAPSGAEPRYAPQQAAPRVQGSVPAPYYAPAPSRAQESAPEARSEAVREAAPAPSRESAPPPSHESAPAPAHESAPAPSHESAPAPAPAPNPDPKGR